MLLQTNTNGVINCENHTSSVTSSTATSPYSSFENHTTPQPHPSLSGMVCSDSSGCGCSNTLDVQSYEDSIAQHSSVRSEGQECRKGEGLKTTARLPHFSQLSTPFVGESASIVTNSNLNTANETAASESDGQHDIYQRMLVSKLLIMILSILTWYCIASDTTAIGSTRWWHGIKITWAQWHH